MRVAIFCEYYFPFISGVVTHIETLKTGLEAAGHEVLLVTLDPKTRTHYVKDNVLYCPALPVKKLYGYGVGNPLNLRRLNILETFNPDVIHMHTEFTMGIFAMFAAKRLKKPSVYTLHTMYDEYMFYVLPNKMPERMKNMAKPVAHTYIRNVANSATEVIGPSFKVVDYMRRCGVERHINIVPNTVDLSDFLPENISAKKIDAYKKELGICPGDVALCFVGRLGKEKSLDVLIDYFTCCFKGEAAFKLFIAGDGPESDALQKAVEAKGMTAQIKLLGRVEHERVPELYGACDLFATASLTEMNSISMIEANAGGLYVVQRLDVLNRDQIHSGKNGDVYTNTDEFAAVIRAYAALDGDGRAARKASVSAFARQYGPKEFTDAILNVYNRAIYEYR